jgi:hypothetical protein
VSDSTARFAVEKSFALKARYYCRSLRSTNDSTVAPGRCYGIKYTSTTPTPAPSGLPRTCAVINGPVSMPFARVPDVQVDLVTVDWQLVAERIVNDLITRDAFQLPGPTVFEAEAKLRVALSDFVQSL